MQQAEEFLRDGRLEDSLAKLQEQVRSDPAKADLRVFLFQLLSITGQWSRALTQLNVAAEIDGEKLLLAEICRPALQAEALRSAVFEGAKSPLVFGEPQEWVGWMIQANQLLAAGQDAAAQKLRDQALERAPAVGGTINGEAFEWVMDADTRLGPILEAIVDGKYFWVPLTRVRAIRIEEPKALRHVVWAEAQFTWANGGQAPGLIPTRYVGSEHSDDPLVRLARRTHWQQRAGEHYLGLGQRTFATDGERYYPLLEVRSIVLHDAEPAAVEAAGPQEPSDG
jgi:type VI secretion system protein ImpE